MLQPCIERETAEVFFRSHFVFPQLLKTLPRDHLGMTGSSWDIETFFAEMKRDRVQHSRALGMFVYPRSFHANVHLTGTNHVLFGHPILTFATCVHNLILNSLHVTENHRIWFSGGVGRLGHDRIADSHPMKDKFFLAP